MDVDEQVASAPAETLCPVCQCAIEPEDEIGECPACSTAYHVECWEDNQGCAVYGCEHVPETKGLSAVETPMSFWGQERKPCPSCNNDIQAAAIRCRNCAAVFPSKEPMSQEDYARHVKQQNRLPKVRVASTVIFVICLIPILSPFGMVLALLWSWIMAKDIKALRSIYPALLKIGIGVGALQLVLYAIIAVICMLRPQELAG